MDQSIPILITCDIDPTPEIDESNRIKAFRLSADLFTKMDITATFFSVAEVAVRFKTQIKTFSGMGHEIGCHGLNHSESEEYTNLSETVQRDYLTRATHILHEIIQKPVRSFRGPRVKTSHTTQKILVELGYHADLSVCPQRIDFISSNLINTNWLFAPRLPYNPEIQSAFKRGNRNILVVPVSAIGLPFISSTLFVFGLSFMEYFFRILYHESQRTGKPIVFILHPAEFAKFVSKKIHKTTFNAIKSRGFYFRRNLRFARDEGKRYHLTEDLLAYMKSFKNSKFMTVNEYVDWRKNSTHLQH